MTDKKSGYCPICQNKAKSEMNGLKTYFFCVVCKFGWLKRLPRSKYEDEYYESGSSLLSKFFAPLGTQFLRIRKSYVNKSLNNFWIDVGAGEGNFLEIIDAKNKIGVEFSRSGRQIMKEKGLSVLTNQQFLKVKNLKADVISFWHVLEHVENPEDYLHAAKNNLSEKGRIEIGVPNVDSFEFQIFKKFWFHLAPEYHLWFFSTKSLEKLLKITGLKIEKIDYFAIEHHFAGTLQTFINAFSNSDNVLHKLIRRRQNLTNLSLEQIFWICFWCTLGLPIVAVFWLMSSAFRKSGALVLIAYDSNRSRDASS